MTRFKMPVGKDLELLKDNFISISAAKSLVQDGAATKPGDVIPISQLYSYAKGEISYPDSKIETALASTPGLRSTYRRMVTASAHYTFKRAVAASEGGPAARKTPGAEITFSDSSAHTDRIYIIIKLTPPVTEPPGTMVVFDNQNRPTRINLPKPQEGIIQLLVSKDSDILLALENTDTSIVLT